jgi:oligopeptide transport system substrate-binding protein
LSSSLQAQWRENLGVGFRWELLEYGAYYDRLDIEPPPIFLSGWLADYPDPDDFLRASPHRSHTRLQDETYTGLVRQARRVTDQATRMKLYRQADKILVEHAVIIPLTYGRLHLLVKPWVRKLPMSPVKAWFWKDVILDPH